MLIMPCRASASRCRVQVTSNVRHPETQIQMQDLRFGNVSPETSSAKVARAEGNRRLVNRSFASESLNSNHKIQRGAQGAPEQPPGRLGPSMVRRAGQTQNHYCRWLPLFRRHAGSGSIQNMVAALVHLARLPNPSVNLTRNSVPHLPGMARHAAACRLPQTLGPRKPCEHVCFEDTHSGTSMLQCHRPQGRQNLRSK
jgi:hypothetical protein